MTPGDTRQTFDAIEIGGNCEWVRKRLSSIANNMLTDWIQTNVATGEEP